MVGIPVIVISTPGKEGMDGGRKAQQHYTSHSIANVQGKVPWGDSEPQDHDGNAEYDKQAQVRQSIGARFEYAVHRPKIVVAGCGRPSVRHPFQNRQAPGVDD